MESSYPPNSSIMVTKDFEMTSVTSEPESISNQYSFPTFYRRPGNRSGGGNRDSGSEALDGGGCGGSEKEDSDRVEYLPMPEEQKLGYFSTIALIVSKIIGTGIFAKPSFVLQNCGSKGVALLLWTGGGFMTFCGLLIYVEFGMAFPFNGGEIVYVEEAFPHPKYLAVTIVSIIFVLITNYAANAVMFAKLILQALNPEIINPDYRLVKFIALVTLTAVCLLHTFSRRLGVFINNFLAIYKIILVVIIIITGAVAMSTGKGKGPAVKGLKYVPPGIHNFENSFEFPDFKPTMSQWGNSILGVLWAYTGWENANYVLGEIKRPPSKETKIFKVATFGSISLITILYLLTNIVYFGVLSTEELRLDDGEMVTAKFLIKVFGNGPFVEKGLKVFVALSVLGNFISIVYGLARVKQEIAKLRILPFSKFWAKQSHYDTPVGALTLHWIFVAIIIVAVPNRKNDDAYNMVTNLFVFSQSWVVLLVCVGMLNLRYANRFHNWEPKIVRWSILQAIIILYMAINVFIIVLTWWPPMHGDYTSSIPYYVTPTVATSVIGIGLLYWVVFAQMLPRIGYHIDSEPDELVDGSRVVCFKRHKTGLAKEMSDWWDSRLKRRRSLFRKM